ncbi:MAG: glycosyltransferase family 4 protein, partial [Oscillospiraceae bacterium]|nr:glycosyltransferase family 4 protein [Oscillospiraceae bacterium]
SLKVGGVSENSVIYKLFNHISRWIYRGADKILITSEMFRKYLHDEFDIENNSIVYHPQYADISFEKSVTIENDTVDLMFAGNIGAAQSIPTILHAAEILKNRTELRWHIVGDGSELEFCKKLAEGMSLSNVIFHGRKTQDEMPAYFEIADAVLITLTGDPIISMTLPGKMQTYMAAGKPIIGAANGEIPIAIEKSGCGFCAPADDAEGFAKAVIKFLGCDNKKAFGENARRFYEANFSRSKFMDNFERELISQI